MARGGRSLISHIRSVHWITPKWETGSQFIKCQGFFCLAPTATPSGETIFNDPTDRTRSFGSKWNENIPWESICSALRLLSRRCVGLHHGVLLFNSHKGESRESEVMTGGIYIPAPCLCFQFQSLSQRMGQRS